MSIPTNQPARTGPSRDVFGGPWVAVLAFLVIAIALGWLLVSLFQNQLDHARQTIEQTQAGHGFSLDTDYVTKQDLILGYLADGRVVLIPGRLSLPAGTPGRRSAVSVEELRTNPQAYPDLIGIVEKGTRVKFVEVIDEPNNPQTRVLVMTRLLNGPYARQTPVLGMHLESTDRDQATGQARAVPRKDLFQSVQGQHRPIQSDTENPALN